MRRLEGNKYIVSYIDSHATHSTNGQGYVVFMLMEYCSKKGLIDFMNTRLVNKLTEPEIINITYDVTFAVACVHSLSPPLIHRDIKIENVLLADDGTFKLCDFGSACPPLKPPRNLEEFQVLQDDILHNTTPQYRCPEMVDLYKRLPIDEKSDIWALGVMLYKLCYYTTPFESNAINGSRNAGGGNYAIVNGIFSFPPSPPFSARLKNVISKTLAVDPKARPDAFQLLEELSKMKGVPFPKQFAAKQSGSAPNYLPSHTFESSTNAPSVIPVRPIPTGTVPTGEIPQGKIPRFNGLVTKSKPIPAKPSKSGADPFSGLHSYFPGASASSGVTNGPLRGNDSRFQHPYQSKQAPSLTQAKFTGQYQSQVQSAMQTPSAESHPRAYPVLSRHRYPSDVPKKSNALNGRPLSMSGADLDGIIGNNNGSAKNRIISPIESIITGMTEEETVELSPGHPPNIDSSVQFLRAVSANNTDSSSNSSLGTKRSSISSLRDLLTGGRFSSHRKASQLSRHSLSSSRISSFAQREKSDGLLDFSRSHVDEQDLVNQPDHYGHKLSHFDKHHQPTKHNFNKVNTDHDHGKTPSVPKMHPPKKSNSIQWRVKELLGRKKAPAPKTANGYGKYTDNTTKKSSKKEVPDVNIIERKGVINGLPKLSMSDVEQADPFALPKTHATKPVRSSISPKSSKKHSSVKAPPPKPRKPAYLRHLSLKSTPGKKILDGTTSKHQRTLSNGSSSLYSEDLETLEKKFEERYPSAL